jgi:hypothetical protein
MSKIKKVERKLRRELLDVYACYEVDNEMFTVDEIIKKLNSLKDSGATHIAFEGSLDHNGELDEVNFNAIREYLESEQEAWERFQMQEKQAIEINNRRLEADRKEYNRLKAIFEKQS